MEWGQWPSKGFKRVKYCLVAIRIYYGVRHGVIVRVVTISGREEEEGDLEDSAADEGRIAAAAAPRLRLPATSPPLQRRDNMEEHRLDSEKEDAAAPQAPAVAPAAPPAPLIPSAVPAASPPAPAAAPLAMRDGMEDDDRPLVRWRSSSAAEKREG